MFEKLPHLFGRAKPDAVEVSVAGDLPPAQPSKPPKKQGSGYPSYLTTVRPDRAAIPRVDRAVTNRDLLTYRQGASTFAVIRDYVASSPDLSNAVFSYLRLGMNRIDILLIHDLDSSFHPDPDTFAMHRNTLLTSGWKALQELKSAGVVGAVGAGLNDRDTMGWYLDQLDVDCFLLALRYTLLEHDVLLDELPRCEENDVGIIIGGAFNSGILATGTVAGAKYNYDKAPVAILDKVGKIEAICARHQTPLAAAALQFPAAHPLVASVVVGALQPEHVTSNIASFDMNIPADLWAELKDAELLPQLAPVPATPSPIQKENP